MALVLCHCVYTVSHCVYTVIAFTLCSRSHCVTVFTLCHHVYTVPLRLHCITVHTVSPHLHCVTAFAHLHERAHGACCHGAHLWQWINHSLLQLRHEHRHVGQDILQAADRGPVVGGKASLRQGTQDSGIATKAFACNENGFPWENK